MSLYDRLQLPSSVSTTLFLLALALFLSPYMGGKSIAGMAIPEFSAQASRSLKRWGWIPVLVALVAFIPLRAPTTTVVRAEFRQQDSTAGCPRLAGSNAILRIDTSTYRAKVDARCNAAFADVPKGHAGRNARVALDPSSPFVVSQAGTQRVDPPQPLTIAIEDTAAAPRLGIAMLAFDVPDPSVRAQLVQFREALRTGIQNLPGMFGDGPSLSYVKRLELQIDSTSILNSNAEMLEHWNRTHALQLLRGQIDGGQQAVKVVLSVWLGALGPPNHVSLPLTMPVAADAFVTNRNGYALITLYALARDAQRRRLPSDVVAAILARANAVRQGIDDPRGELRPIIAGIDTMLAELRRSAP
jgi:hypothetical protein